MHRLLLVVTFTLGLSGFAQAGGLDDAKLGLATLKAGDLKEAIAYNTRAIESGELERESLAIAYYNRASGYLLQEKRALAVEDFKRAYRAWPEHPVTQQKMRALDLLKAPQ